MSTFTNRTKPETSFANREITSGMRVVGDMTEQDFITLLGSAPGFDTDIPGVVDGPKTFGELTFLDRLFAPSSLWAFLSRASSSWSNRALE